MGGPAFALPTDDPASELPPLVALVAPVVLPPAVPDCTTPEAAGPDGRAGALVATPVECGELGSLGIDAPPYGPPSRPVLSWCAVDPPQPDSASAVDNAMRTAFLIRSV